MRSNVSATALSSIARIDATVWNACVGGDPFMSHAFLLALEETGCLGPERGWLPQYLTLSDAQGLLAAAPAYVKGNSFGEYVFDFSWADAYRRVGRAYYPKLQCAVPFTPVTGPRLLVRNGPNQDSLRRELLAALCTLAEHHHASSMHVTFPTRAEWERGGELGLIQRIGIQYHWHNRDYARFADFLGDLLGRKRRQVQRERRDAQVGATIQVLRGDEIRAEHWDTFFRFYCDTIARKWGEPYLTRALFERIGQALGDRIVLLTAKDDGKLVAAALNLLGPDALYGRYWGALGNYPFLHFELCYYRAIELAIELGLSRVEAGAQGEHKLARGYLPVETYSLHWLADPDLHAAIATAVARETELVREQARALFAESPYRDDREAARKNPRP